MEYSFSIIVPVFNSEKTITNCLNSICNTFKNEKYEIIVVDDGSNDQSSVIVKEYTKNNSSVKYIHQNNKGPSAARNTGIKHAKGMFLLFVDSDDELLNDFCNSILCAYKKTQSDLIIGDLYINIDEEKEKSLNESNKIEYFDKEDFLKNFFKYLKLGKLNSPCAKLYKKDIIIKQSILFDESLFMGEDLQFNLNYILNIKSLVFLNKDIYKYNTYNSYLTKKFYENLFESRKKSVLLLNDFLIKANLNNNIVYFLYLKLVYAQIIQTYAFPKKNYLSRTDEINNLLCKPEVKQSLKKFLPVTIYEKIIYYSLKSNFINLIKIIGFIFYILKYKIKIPFNRVSV